MHADKSRELLNDDDDEERHVETSSREKDSGNNARETYFRHVYARICATKVRLSYVFRLDKSFTAAAIYLQRISDNESVYLSFFYTNITLHE